MEKRGQFWFSDFMIGIIIMITITILFFSTIVGLYESNDKIDELINNGVVISDYFMSSGYLHDQWSSGQGRIGFVDNGRVNEENLSIFVILVSTEDGYSDSKYLLGTSYDYVFYFEDRNGNVANDEFIGNNSINSLEDISNIKTDYMIKLVRFVYYYDEIIEINDIVKMVVVLWD